MAVKDVKEYYFKMFAQYLEMKNKGYRKATANPYSLYLIIT